jgi:hypothetical protein
MNGSISLDSTEHKGSEFTIKLKTQLGDVSKLSYRAGSKIAGTESAQKPMYILIAEDTLVNAMVAKAFLKHMGHRAEVEVNGALALSAVKEKTMT